MNEAIDRLRGPIEILWFGNGWIGHRPVRPELSSGFDVDRAVGCYVAICFLWRRRCSAGNPFLEQFDGRFGELAGRWHFQVAGMPDGSDQQTLIWFTWNKCRTTVSAGQPALLRIKAKIGFQRFAAAVTFVAVLDELRPDLLFVELEVGRGGFGGKRRS